MPSWTSERGWGAWAGAGGSGLVVRLQWDDGDDRRMMVLSGLAARGRGSQSFGVSWTETRIVVEVRCRMFVLLVGDPPLS
jgi:hypothetical protein